MSQLWVIEHKEPNEVCWKPIPEDTKDTKEEALRAAASWKNDAASWERTEYRVARYVRAESPAAMEGEKR